MYNVRPSHRALVLNQPCTIGPNPRESLLTKNFFQACGLDTPPSQNCETGHSYASGLAKFNLVDGTVTVAISGLFPPSFVSQQQEGQFGVLADADPVAPESDKRGVLERVVDAISPTASAQIDQTPIPALANNFENPVLMRKLGLIIDP